MSIEEKIKELVTKSVELEHAFTVAAHGLNELSQGTPHSKDMLEAIIRVSINRGRYDDMLRRLLQRAVDAGHLASEYISGVVAGLQDQREAAGALARELTMAERTQGVVN